MKIKRIRKIRIGGEVFTVKWHKGFSGGSFSYPLRELVIGTKDPEPSWLLQVIVHELWEIATVEVGVRYERRDVEGAYLFSYNHQQHDTMCCWVSGWLSQFIA